MMETLKTVPGIAHFAALGGLNVVTFATKSNSGTIFVQLKPWDERTDKSLQLASLIIDAPTKVRSHQGGQCRGDLSAGNSRVLAKREGSRLSWSSTRAPTTSNSSKVRFRRSLLRLTSGRS